MLLFLDINEKEIKRGDYFIYAALLGRSAVLKHGKVVDLVVRGSTYGSPSAYISAITVEYSNWNSKYILQKKGSPIPLNFPERCCVIPVEILPAQVRDLLNSVK